MEFFFFGPWIRKFCHQKSLSRNCLGLGREANETSRLGGRWDVGQKLRGLCWRRRGLFAATGKTS